MMLGLSLICFLLKEIMSNIFVCFMNTVSDSATPLPNVMNTEHDMCHSATPMPSHLRHTNTVCHGSMPMPVHPSLNTLSDSAASLQNFMNTVCDSSIPMPNLKEGNTVFHSATSMSYSRMEDKGGEKEGLFLVTNTCSPVNSLLSCVHNILDQF